MLRRLERWEVAGSFTYAPVILKTEYNIYRGKRAEAARTIRQHRIHANKRLEVAHKEILRLRRSQ